MHSYASYKVGSLGAGQVSDRWGRRVGMGVGSFICLVGAVFQAAAQNVNYLIAGRVVLGLGAVIAQTAGKAIPRVHFPITHRWR